MRLGDRRISHPRHRPETLHPVRLAPESQEDHARYLAVLSGRHSQAEHEPVHLISLPERQSELLCLALLLAERPLVALFGIAAEEAHRHALDQEGKVVRLVQHAETRVTARLGGTAEVIAAEGEGPTADRPDVVAEPGHRT
ncbi:hypothetical protein [Roseomonas sp. KE2513]|uniref:hypothetical protein n=1 Tax=Roseomonas sp. KE2513 TaxID=2479202 RepID=UPI0018E02BAA|nr:hypothetical protein [Roseomonas sp. KE2513]